ncbi:hypothetical protein N8267_01510 [Pelagibacteraceae bacterium]|nr:hypothetical protein [Pelagibacteraceae bacterium]
MYLKRTLLIALSLFSLIVFSSSQAETLTFGNSIYEGEVKKGKAYGEGVLTFSDGTFYKGKFKKNKPHGVGAYTDERENIHEGKWRFGKFKSKKDKKTRLIFKLSAEEGPTNYFEIKGKGVMSTKWFEAELDAQGGYSLTKKGKRDMETEKKAAESASSNSSGSSGGSS